MNQSKTMKALLVFSITCLVSAFLALAFTSSAHAQTVVGVDGVKVLGADALLAVSSDSLSGNRAIATYSSGAQYLPDDAAFTKTGKLITQCGVACLTVDGGYVYKAIAVGRSNGVYCQGNQSAIAFPNMAQPITIADNCAFWAKVKANSQ